MHTFASYLNFVGCGVLAKRGYTVLCADGPDVNVRHAAYTFEDQPVRVAQAVGYCGLGRDIHSVLILATPRGAGPLGPLKRLPASDGTDALWLQFAPNKDGPEATVNVSPALKDLVTYCVQELI